MDVFRGISDGWVPDSGCLGRDAREILANISFKGRKQASQLIQTVEKSLESRYGW